MLRPMKLEGALKLYIALYTLAFALTFLSSVPMLKHVAPKGECLLFLEEKPRYGPASGCIIAGILPLLVAVAALGLIFIHWLQLRNLKEHVKTMQMSSEEFRQGFRKKFWRMIITHAVVVGLVFVQAIVLTTGYTISCQSLYRYLKPRISHRPSVIQNTNVKNREYDTERFEDDWSRQYYNADRTNFFGQDKTESGLTCKKLLSDPKNHLELLKNRDQRQFQHLIGFQNLAEDAGSRNLQTMATEGNLTLELSMAGAWIGLFIWGLMLALMLKERHHLKAFITDESMWGGSDYGAGSIKSGRSRKSQNGRVMSPIDFENMDRMSHASKMSYDRSSRISRASKGSKGTSYKDMGSSKPRSSASSYKNMNGRGSSAPSQLTASRLEKVPEVDTGYTVNRLLNDNPHNRVHTPTNGQRANNPTAASSQQRGRNGKPPTGRQHYAPQQIESADPGDLGDMESVANMSMMTVTGAVIGPTANTLGSGRGGGGGGGLMDFFAGPADTSSVLDSSIMGPPPTHTTEESDIM